MPPYSKDQQRLVHRTAGTSVSETDFRRSSPRKRASKEFQYCWREMPRQYRVPEDWLTATMAASRTPPVARSNSRREEEYERTSPCRHPVDGLQDPGREVPHGCPHRRHGARDQEERRERSLSQTYRPWADRDGQAGEQEDRGCLGVSNPHRGTSAGALTEAQDAPQSARAPMPTPTPSPSGIVAVNSVLGLASANPGDSQTVADDPKLHPMPAQLPPQTPYLKGHEEKTSPSRPQPRSLDESRPHPVWREDL